MTEITTLFIWGVDSNDPMVFNLNPDSELDALDWYLTGLRRARLIDSYEFRYDLPYAPEAVLTDLQLIYEADYQEWLQGQEEHLVRGSV
jgi:hypothetical protein